MKGTIVYRLSNVGSKSEGIFPFLYTGEGNFVRVWMINDVSFDATDLKPYDGKYVELQGSFNENQTFFISTIEILYPTENA